MPAEAFGLRTIFVENRSKFGFYPKIINDVLIVGSKRVQFADFGSFPARDRGDTVRHCDLIEVYVEGLWT